MPPTQTSEASTAVRLVIHAVDADGLKRARQNARNLLQARPDARVEIVANGAAVAAALDQTDETDALLRLCENTLRATDRTAPTHLARVPAAILHLAERQGAGWAYVRA